MKMAGILIAIVLLLGVAAVIAIRAAQTGEKAPAAGKPAPAFTLNSQGGKPVSLHDFKGQWVVLYFYPMDFTSGCTREARNFQRDVALYEQKNAVILGLSGQDVASHEKFCAKEGLTFKLLADRNHEVSKAYGSLMNLGIASLSARHTFLIDPEGVIRKAYLKVDAQKHSGEVLADLTELRQASSAK